MSALGSHTAWTLINLSLPFARTHRGDERAERGHISLSTHTDHLHWQTFPGFLGQAWRGTLP